MSRSSFARCAAAVITVTMIGGPALIEGHASAASAPPAAAHEVLRSVAKVPIVLGPAPAAPTLVPATPHVGTGGIHASSTTAAFVVNYDAGFNANPSAKLAFQYAVDQWANVISSPVPIVVDAQFSALPPGVLGSAGPNAVDIGFPGAPLPNTYYPIALANALSGSDRDPGVADIGATFSSTFPSFYFGTDGNTAGNLDFVSVVLHELGHGLGFLGAVTVDNAGVGDYCCGLGLPLAYDRFTTSNGQKIDQIPAPSVAMGNAVKGQAVRFTGLRASAANNGQPVPLYAPASWQGGSSYSHVDEATYPAGNPNSLMTPGIGVNEVIHSPGPVTLGILADTGWVLGNLPRLDIAPARVVEGNADLRFARFNVSLSSPSTSPVSFYYQTLAGTATSPADFAGRTGFVTIPAGVTSTTVNIGVRGDRTVEGLDKFRVQILAASGANVGATTASGYIMDDDPSVDPRFGIGTASIVEGTSGVRKVRLSITLSKKHTAPTSVQWATGGGTATAGNDYTAASGTVTFPAGITDRVVNINVVADTTTEASEYFRVTLTNAVGAGIQRAGGTVTIVNDD